MPLDAVLLEDVQLELFYSRLSCWRYPIEVVQRNILSLPLVFVIDPLRLHSIDDYGHQGRVPAR